MNRIEEIRKQLVPADFFKQEFHRAQESVVQRGHRPQREPEAGPARARNGGAGAVARVSGLARLARRRAELSRRSCFAGGSPPAATPAGLRSLVNAPPASAGDIAATATRLGSTFLLYWVAQDSLVAWVVTPDGAVRARRLPVLRSRLDELVRATAPLPEPGDAAADAISPQARGATWYDLLIQPVRDTLPRTRGSLVTIVPHGPLLNLSFAALQDARGRYLLEDYTISYAPAASMLQLTSARRHPGGRTGDALLVADPSMPALSRLERPLPRLPGARSEVDAIARLLLRRRVTSLRDTAATEAGVRAAASRKAVLHFATHAIVRDDDPFKSFLALGPGSGGADDDGLLTAQEVYGLDARRGPGRPERLSIGRRAHDR